MSLENVSILCLQYGLLSVVCDRNKMHENHLNEFHFWELNYLTDSIN
jgi:hypothetical protein